MAIPLLRIVFVEIHSATVLQTKNNIPMASFVFQKIRLDLEQPDLSFHPIRFFSTNLLPPVHFLIETSLLLYFFPSLLLQLSVGFSHLLLWGNACQILTMPQVSRFS